MIGFITVLIVLAVATVFADALCDGQCRFTLGITFTLLAIYFHGLIFS